MADVISIAGLATSLAGVLMLFRYGMPYRVSSPDGSFILSERPNPEGDQEDARYRVFGFIGLFLIVAGTVAQIIAVLMKA